MGVKTKTKSSPSSTAAVIETDGESPLVYRAVHELKPWAGNARVHDERQIAALMASIQEFGFQGAIVTNEDGIVLAGHGRLEAARRLKLEKVPARIARGLSLEQQRAYVMADNKLSEMSKWDRDVLKTEIELLIETDFHIEVTGFSTAEIDIMLDDKQPQPEDVDDLQPADISATPSITKVGDLWQLGDHKLLCGDALEAQSYDVLMAGELAQMVITDPPYNVPIGGHVCGSGKIKHDEFAMASGEMTEEQFTDFLAKAFGRIKEFSADGGIIYGFMDWRHQREMLNAAEPLFGKLKQLCVWTKDNAGMGTFYRSQHELVFLFRNGDKAHINNFELGQHGRYRTNVWSYPGVNSFGHTDLLKLHPTVKPVSMIADAMRDCSHRKGLVLDPFAGSGTIIMAAERTGRCARAIELEPGYVDTAIQRWERVTGKSVIHEETGLTFGELRELRATEG